MRKLERRLRRSLEGFRQLYRQIEDEIDELTAIKKDDYKLRDRICIEIKRRLQRDISAFSVAFFDPIEERREKAQWAFPRAQELLKKIEKLEGN